MDKWTILVYTDRGHYSYGTNSDSRKSSIIEREKKKSEVVQIFVNQVSCYKR